MLTKKKLGVYLALTVFAEALIAVIALCGCAAPRAPAHLPTTEAEVRETFSRDRVVKVLDNDGTHLVVYLRPRPAAPRGGFIVYEVRRDGTVRCVRTVVAD